VVLSARVQRQNEEGGRAARRAADGVPRERMAGRGLSLSGATPAPGPRGSTADKTAARMCCADLDSLRQPVDQSEGAGDKVAD